MPEYWYPTAFSCWGDEEKAAIERVIASGKFTMGEEVAAFEREMAAYHGRKHCIAVNSGSSANLVAVAALGEIRRSVPKGNFWVNSHPFNFSAHMPAIAWATTYAPFVQLCDGNAIAFVHDVDDTWNSVIPPTTFVKGSRLGAYNLVACSILGNPAHLSDARLYIDTMNDEQGQRLYWLLEDNAESLGARTSDGRLTGTFGDISTGSGFYSHQLSATELGWILTDDDEIARFCRLLRNHGNDGWGSEDFDKSYNFVLFGFNVRPVEMHAAIAREQLKKLDAMIDRRRQNYELFRGLTENLVIHPRRNGQMSPFGMHFCVSDNDTRRRLVREFRSNDIDCRLPTGGSFRMHEYGKLWRGQQTPNADRIHQTGLFLGNAPWDISDKIERAVNIMREIL
jgi:CDP-6-deoxy-D-xylo-4-hexulose-3-dehydrase